VRTKLVPEVASQSTVSRSGKASTFTVRKGFSFSDGSAVSAKNFKYAIDRVANKDLASPGAQFITDPNGTNIVGAIKVNNGQAKHVSGAVIKGNKLIIHLTKGDGTFMAKITMPFFQATSTKLPIDKEVVTVNGSNLPSAGPYYYSRNDVNQLTSVKKNTHYTKAPGRIRPHNLQDLDAFWNQTEQTLFNQTLANPIDEANTIPPD